MHRHVLVWDIVILGLDCSFLFTSVEVDFRYILWNCFLTIFLLVHAWSLILPVGDSWIIIHMWAAQSYRFVIRHGIVGLFTNLSVFFSEAWTFDLHAPIVRSQMLLQATFSASYLHRSHFFGFAFLTSSRLHFFCRCSHFSTWRMRIGWLLQVIIVRLRLSFTVCLIIVVFWFFLFFFLFSWVVFVLRRCLVTFFVFTISVIRLPISKELLLEIQHPRMLEDLDQWDSLIWLLFEELVDQVFVFLRDLWLKSNLLLHLVAGNRTLVTSVGSIAVDQLIKKNTKCPDVKHVVMLPVVDHLRCHVLKCTAKSIPLPFIHVAVRILL